MVGCWTSIHPGTPEPPQMKTIEEIEDPSGQPLCPHCEKTIAQINFKRIRSTFGVKFIHYCPHCRKVLGISHRKGFWMG